MFLLIYLYPLRKRWAWLGRQGSSRHWLDFHVSSDWPRPSLSLFIPRSNSPASPASLLDYDCRFLSGVVGRYIYAQIPRSLNFAELSFKEAQEQSAALAAQLQTLGILTQKDIASVVRLRVSRRRNGCRYLEPWARCFYLI